MTGMHQESPTRFKYWLFSIMMRGLLQTMLMVVLNANGKTAEEISETTGIKPVYVELTLGILSGMGIVEEKDGRYYVDEEVTGLCELMIEGMLRGPETSLSG
jgi:predicted transcriptional regulator